MWFVLVPWNTTNGEKLKTNDMMNIVADWYYSWEQRQKVHQPQEIEESECLVVGDWKVTAHKNIQSLNDYDETNEDEQQQLSYATSERNNFNPQPTVSRQVHKAFCAITAFWKSSSKLIPNWTWNRMITYTNNLINTFICFLLTQVETNHVIWLLKHFHGLMRLLAQQEMTMMKHFHVLE